MEQHRIEQQLVDVRQGWEYAGGHIAGSRLVPLSTLTRQLADWDRDTPILLICRSGHRATVARNQLTQLGFTHLDVLPGGIMAWSAAGKPLERSAKGGLPFSERTLGLLVLLLTAVLGLTVSHTFFAATAMIGGFLAFQLVRPIAGTIRRIADRTRP